MILTKLLQFRGALGARKAAHSCYRTVARAAESRPSLVPARAAVKPGLGRTGHTARA
jgi:hypothetical protein